LSTGIQRVGDRHGTLYVLEDPPPAIRPRWYCHWDGQAAPGFDNVDEAVSWGLERARSVLVRTLGSAFFVAGEAVAEYEPEARPWPPSSAERHAIDAVDDETKFAKYQTVSVTVRRPKTDRRPESWAPLHGSIVPTEALGTEHGWARRRHLVERLGEARMCDLIEANRSGSGPGVPSLAVVRPVEPPTLQITPRDEEQLRTWRERASAAASRLSLFDAPARHKPELEVVPWRFRYAFHCSAPSCNGHAQTIVDWEVAALRRRVRHRDDWMDAMRLRFERDLWRGRDSVLFVGNQEQRPISFLVLGVFWPPAGPAQRLLDL
jgi:hypothetical protein